MVQLESIEVSYFSNESCACQCSWNILKHECGNAHLECNMEHHKSHHTQGTALRIRQLYRGADVNCKIEQTANLNLKYLSASAATEPDANKNWCGQCCTVSTCTRPCPSRAPYGLVYSAATFASLDHSRNGVQHCDTIMPMVIAIMELKNETTHCPPIGLDWTAWIRLD